LSSLGVDPTTFTDPNSATVAGESRGNPTLEEEIAETTTVGIVLRPRFAPSLSIAVDWYDIELTNAISVASAEESAQICVDSPTLDNEFCELITREPGTAAIVNFVQRPLNVANFTTEGYDFTVNYRVDPVALGAKGNWGDFNLRLIGNKLEDLTFINLPGSEPDPELGEEDAPEWQMNFDLTWQLGSLLVNYGFNYFDETYRYTFQERRANPDIVADEYRKYDARFTHDIQARYRLQNGLAVYGGVNNLTDQEPDIGQTFYPVSALGRYWYLGATFNKF
jgi:iron complex outermembrane receptor protein